MQVHSANRKTFVEADLEVAALAIDLPDELRTIRKNHAVGSASRAKALRDALLKLSVSGKTMLSDAKAKAAKGALPLLRRKPSEEGAPPAKGAPLEMEPEHPSLLEFFTAEAICKGYELPPESSAPWRWDERWANTLALGAAIGPTFDAGLLKASSESSNDSLTIRALIGGHRATAFKCVGMLLTAVKSVDLRDNRIDDNEAQFIAEVLKNAPLLTRLNLAGNYISPKGTKLITMSIDNSGPRARNVADLNLSRNPITGASQSAEAGLLDIAQATALNCTLHTLALRAIHLSDELGAKFLNALEKAWPTGPPQTPPEAFTPPPTSKTSLSVVPPTRFLTRLDLSSNRLGPKFSQAFPDAVRYLPALADLNLSGNDLGVSGCDAILTALLTSETIRSLDLSSTNLCNITSQYGSIRTEWSIEAVRRLCEVPTYASRPLALSPSRPLALPFALNPASPRARARPGAQLDSSVRALRALERPMWPLDRVHLRRARDARRVLDDGARPPLRCHRARARLPLRAQRPQVRRRQPHSRRRRGAHHQGAQGELLEAAAQRATAVL